MTTTTPTPMMAQWHACKEKAKDALVFFRLGDFYEAFYEDAELISREINLTLTKRQDIPMCGVPFHTCESYIDKLIARGHKVAVVEQLEDPKQVKGIVKRDIVRTVTPGTLVTSSLLSDKSNNFLVSLTQVGAHYGLALLDLSTSDFRVMELDEKKNLLDELTRIRPSELIVSEKFHKAHADVPASIQELFPVTITTREEWYFDHESCLNTLLIHLRVQTLDGFGLRGMLSAINAAGALLAYVVDELHLNADHVETIRKESLSDFMALDRVTQYHLELTASNTHRNSATLLSVIDRTATPMGGRMIKAWVSHPLIDEEKIRGRQEAIQAFLSTSFDIVDHLKKIRDLERLIMRISSGYGSPRDCQALRLSLEEVPPLKNLLSSVDAPLIQEQLAALHDLTPLTEKIKEALVEAPPLRLSDGGIFRKGYNEELDELRSIVSDSQAWIARYQTSLREETGIKTLKVGYTRAFGYYIEVSRAQSSKMPESFHRRQTLVNTERFISPELKEYEVKALNAEEKIGRLEASLFQALREEIIQETQKIITIAHSIATIDTLHSLATIAGEKGYTCPRVDTSFCLEITGGRHPVIEESLKSETFIPNDTHLDDKESRLMLITGPNMAGKSTYMRQVALIVILAHIGSFVPAQKAHIGIVDKVFTRIGASDDLSRGQSTFMVEMAETANILHNATPRSLVILDEIGRGTSTFDGISIAWAVAEYLLTKKSKGAKTLFATHYWELTELEIMLPGAVNFNVAVKETDGGIVFLHKIEKGCADKSYGIHVAKLAGLPTSVLKRAEERLRKLEKLPSTAGRLKELDTPSEKSQLSLF